MSLEVLKVMLKTRVVFQALKEHSDSAGTEPKLPSYPRSLANMWTDAGTRANSDSRAGVLVPKCSIQTRLALQKTRIV